MKQLSFTILLVLMAFTTQAQYGNEWINYNQTYVKFATAKEGIYRISYKTLQNAGIPISSIDPRNIQIYNNGVEQKIWINGEADGVLDTSDYIELFCGINDGKLDEPLFRSKNEQSHQYTSLYQDSAIYFLTWTTSTPGKRYQLNSDVDYTGTSPDKYFLYNSVMTFTNQWLDGLPYADLGYFAEYTNGEGYHSANITGSVRTFALPSPLYDSTGPKPLAYVLAYSASNPDVYDADGKNHELEFAIANGAKREVLFSEKHRGYNRIEYKDLEVPKYLIRSTTTQFQFSSIYGGKGRHVASLLVLKYPRKFDLAKSTSFVFDLPGTNNTFVQFLNYGKGANQPIVYNVQEGIRFTPTLAGTTLKFKTNGEIGKTIIADETDVNSISDLKPVKFNNFSNVSGEFDYLVITHSSLTQGTKAFTDYRSSSTGGNHKLIVANADELYDEFYYGVHHPLAMKNWIYFIYDRQNVKPEYLLLMGKGQLYINTRFDENLRQNGDLVPTMGWPPSDYLFTTPLSAKNMRPDLATGRIPVTTNEQIYNYVDKLKEFETYPITTKTVLQMAGGEDASQNDVIEGYLSTYAKIIEADSFGGNVTLVSKQNATTVDETLIDQIIGTVNSGVNLVNYFGHGAASVTEIDFGKVQLYKNSLKYPVYFFDGCILGNSFETAPALLEEFLLEPNKGAIAWIAGSFYGYTNELNSITKTFHKNTFQKMYGSSIGKVMQQTINEYQNLSNAYTITQSRVMLLHGDPAIVIYSPDKPDYTVDSKTIELNTNKTAVDSFTIDFKMVNLGKVTYDSVRYFTEVRNGGTLILLDTSFAKPFGSSTLISRKFSSSNLLSGLNRITIQIDPSNLIAELAPNGESNNNIVRDIFISKNELEILSPTLDEIISNQSMSIQFTTNKQSSNAINYRILVDTMPSFSSSTMIQKDITSSDFIVEAKLDLPNIDSTDFYISVVNLNNPDTAVTSIAYIAGSLHGASQGYWEKFKGSTLTDLTMSSNRRLEFNRTISDNIILTTSGTSIKLGGGGQYGKAIYYGDINYKPGIILLAINPNDESRYYEKNSFNVKSGNPWDINDLYDRYYGKDSLSCLYRFNTNLKNDRDSLVAFLNRVPDGYFLGMMNETTTGIASWEEEVFTALEAFGAVEIRKLKENQPYIVWGKKGWAKGAATELFADFNNKTTPPESQQVLFSTTIYPLETSGEISSRVFGPSVNWSQAWMTHSQDNAKDVFSVDVIGYDKDNKAETLITADPKIDIIDLTSVDATKYPFLQLRVKMSDVGNRTPTQINRWTVLFEDLPEGVAFSESTELDTIEEGDAFAFSSVFKNISNIEMDSIVVEVTHMVNGNQESVEYDTLKKLVAGDTVQYNVLFANLDQPGLNSFIVLFNPNYQQSEKTISNNVISKEVFVNSNAKVPTLDVYFDNQQIMNGQLINPNARVSVLGRSNHPVQLIQDAELYQVSFIKKGGTKGDTILWTNSNLSFTPESENSPSKFNFNFEDLPGGTYAFNAKLFSPTAGKTKYEGEYSIEFEVSDKNEITELLPYPNPMVNHCRFAYSYGGRNIPSKYHLSIFNINGKLVREVSQDEFGPLLYGNQLSEFVFDGKDNFGDQLANGVYLYKFEIKDAEKKEASIDRFFEGGYGKIFIGR